ncbi:synapse differentiation-inducing gene protein 1-like isoform X2 [Saccostrea cucullata]|uniref:synapse differentiation-inducing gene protein 1-like isoform X2 n=1 Tax=Saccostrea cuccullata TaxID=36930 RepID=UPI002ED24E0E
MANLPWWNLGGKIDSGYVYAMSKKSKSREPVLLDAAEASDDETKPLYSGSYRGLSYAPNVAYIRKPPKDFRAGALLSAIFCFLPLGLFALYYSCKVNKLYQRGNLTESIKASDRTRFLINITLLFGSLLWFGGIVGVVLFTNRHH